MIVENKLDKKIVLKLDTETKKLLTTYSKQTIIKKADIVRACILYCIKKDKSVPERKTILEHELQVRVTDLMIRTHLSQIDYKVRFYNDCVYLCLKNKLLTIQDITNYSR